LPAIDLWPSPDGRRASAKIGVRELHRIAAERYSGFVNTGASATVSRRVQAWLLWTYLDQLNALQRQMPLQCHTAIVRWRRYPERSAVMRDDRSNLSTSCCVGLAGEPIAFHAVNASRLPIHPPGAPCRCRPGARPVRTSMNVSRGPGTSSS